MVCCPGTSFGCWRAQDEGYSLIHIAPNLLWEEGPPIKMGSCASLRASELRPYEVLVQFPLGEPTRDKLLLTKQLMGAVKYHKPL